MSSLRTRLQLWNTANANMSLVIFYIGTDHDNLVKNQTVARNSCQRKQKQKFMKGIIWHWTDAPFCLSPDSWDILSDQNITVETAGKPVCHKLPQTLWYSISFREPMCWDCFHVLHCKSFSSSVQLFWFLQCPMLFFFLGQSTHECDGFVYFCYAWLTDGGDEVQEAFLWEERVLQSSEVKLEHSSHRVDVMLILVVNQGIFTWFITTCAH